MYLTNFFMINQCADQLNTSNRLILNELVNYKKCTLLIHDLVLIKINRIYLICQVMRTVLILPKDTNKIDYMQSEHVTSLMFTQSWNVRRQ